MLLSQPQFYGIFLKHACWHEIILYNLQGFELKLMVHILFFSYRGERVLDAKHKLILEDKLSSAFGKTWAARGDEQKEVEKFLQIVMECCEVENLVSQITEKMMLAIISYSCHRCIALCTYVHKYMRRLMLNLSYYIRIMTHLQITVFDMNKHEDLDLAILSALLKGIGRV